MQQTFKLSALTIALLATFTAFAQSNTQTVEVTGSRI